MGYQIGIIGRHNISDHVFVEGTVAIASTAINLERSYSFTSVNIGVDGLTNSFVKETTDVQARYARNVAAIGANPSLGLRLTDKFSFSGGVAVYKNITPSLALTNGKEFGNEVLTQAVVDNTHSLNTWDVGLTGNADYKVKTKLSLNVNYRKGVTDYYRYNNKGYKNSMINIGIKYMLSR